MNRSAVYAELAAELSSWQALPHVELLERTNQPTISRTIESPEGPITIEVQARWTNNERKIVRVSATAYGPTSWHTDRLEEHCNVQIVPV